MLKQLFVTLALLLVMSTLRAQQTSLAIEDMQAIREANGLQAVAGIALNRSDKVIKNAFVKFNLYDAQGILVGNTITHAANLGPGERWRFKALASQNFSTVKVSDIQLYDN